MPSTRFVWDVRSNDEPSSKQQDFIRKAGEIIHDYQVIFFDLATNSRVHDKADIVRISGTKFCDGDFDSFAVPRRPIPTQASRIHGIRREGRRLFLENQQVGQGRCYKNDAELMKEWAKWVDESALGHEEIVLVGYSAWKIEMMKMKMPPTTVKVTYIDLMERMKRSGLCRGIRDFSLDTVLRRFGVRCSCNKSFGTVKDTACNTKRILKLTEVASQQAKSGCELAFLGIPGHPVTGPECSHPSPQR